MTTYKNTSHKKFIEILLDEIFLECSTDAFISMVTKNQNEKTKLKLEFCFVEFTLEPKIQKIGNFMLL